MLLVSNELSNEKRDGLLGLCRPKRCAGLLTGKLFGTQRVSDRTTMGLSQMSIACRDALGTVFMLTSEDNACLQGRSVKQVPEVGSRAAGLHSCTGTYQ